jgi:hypothetical protein
MTTVEFSCPRYGIIVEIHDGSRVCSGNYEGAQIKFALPIDGGACCVLLLDPDASTTPVFENLICIDLAGSIIWRARLPAIPDAFLSITRIPEGILTKTWSGMSLLLDPATGRELARNFVK